MLIFLDNCKISLTKIVSLRHVAIHRRSDRNFVHTLRMWKSPLFSSQSIFSMDTQNLELGVEGIVTVRERNQQIEENQ